MMTEFEKEYIKARKEYIRAEFSHLNDRQIDAVMATEGPLLILAGAGSGKTTVLINRIANLLKYGKASDSDELPAFADEKTLEALKARGLTIFLTSHFMDEVEALCDEICILKKGVPVFRGTVEQAKIQCGCSRFEDAYLQLSDEEADE